jgi:hypothetical protein
MKACMSPLARQVLQAGIHPKPGKGFYNPGEPFTFEGKQYTAMRIPTRPSVETELFSQKEMFWMGMIVLGASIVLTGLVLITP